MTMKRALQTEIKKLKLNHIRPVVEERIILEALDNIGDWLGETARKITIDLTDQEIEEALNVIHDLYVEELISQLKSWPKRNE